MYTNIFKMAAMAQAVTHDYAVYSQHLLPKSKLSNGFDEQERISKIDENESHDNHAKIVSESSISKQNAYRLSLLSSNMQADQETSLRSFLTKRFAQHQPLTSSGNIISIPAGKVYDQNAMVYFHFMTEGNYDSQTEDDFTSSRDNQDSKQIFLICFIAVVETGLDLFQSELDNYCSLLSPYIHKYMESVDVSEYLKRLEAWYEINVCYVQRCLSYLDQQLSSVLFATFLGQEVKMVGLLEEAQRDLKTFMDCCSLSELLQEKREAVLAFPRTSKTFLEPETELLVEFDGKDYTLSSKSTNPFCNDCIKSIELIGQGDPFKMRQVIENYKLKVIQDMNTFKRLSKQAETDYYALYRLYGFLLSCDNGDVLLKNAKNECEHEEDKGSKEILAVIEEFIDGKKGFEGIQKEEKSKMKAQHLLRLLNF